MSYYIDQLAEQDRQKRLADLLAMQQDNSEPGVQFDTPQQPIPQQGSLSDLMNSGASRDQINALLSQSSMSTDGFQGQPEPPEQPVQQEQPRQFTVSPDDGLQRLNERPGSVEQAQMNTIRNNTTGEITNMPSSGQRRHDVYRDGPQILKKIQNPDGTYDQVVKKATTDGFGRQSTVLVRETVTPDYLNPAMIAKDKMDKTRAEIANLTAKQVTPEQAQELERRKALGKQQGEMQGFGSIAQAGATGASALTGIPPAMADQVKALADGRMAFPSGFALKSPYWQQMLQLVSQYDPNFDAINYNARSKTRQDFTSGKSAENIKSLNTAIGHLGTLTEKFDALNNSSIPSYNTAANWLGKKSGVEKIQGAIGGFDTAKLAVSGEMAKVFRSVGMSQQEIEHWMDRLSSSQTPADFKSTMKTATDLMGGRLDAIGDQYSKGMGRSTQGLDLLSPDAKAQFQKIQGGGTQKLTSTDGDAMAWAMKNPNDPRSAAIKAKLGVR